MTGLGIGMAAGAMLEAVMMPKKKGMKCASGKMMHSIGDVVDSIAAMMR